MTKDEALQKVNDYCNEKSYTTATLTDGFKEKFAEHFAKRYPDAAADDETALGDMKFALNTAFSGASAVITDKTREFETKENGYKSQIAELTKKKENGGGGKKDGEKVVVQIPDEVQRQLDELKRFKDDEAKKVKFKDIIAIAKKGIRKDLHKSFETFMQDFDVSLGKESKEQADYFTARFQEIFKDTIADIKPLAPQQTSKRDSDVMSQIPRCKV